MFLMLVVGFEFCGVSCWMSNPIRPMKIPVASIKPVKLSFRAMLKLLVIIHRKVLTTKTEANPSKARIKYERQALTSVSTLKDTEYKAYLIEMARTLRSWAGAYEKQT